ncbi:hypothetical protein PS655_06052 [Pseudomonas fluorescens]|uniref:Uncharacterized protein n=1 Tax=Pseudomonas fluorescens TaxID=294 RepID=A0A5E6Y4X7_PSEFL|nr:hypothetical protein PS655_06052 [Pseudomonas fluorescens]
MGIASAQTKTDLIACLVVVRINDPRLRPAVIALSDRLKIAAGKRPNINAVDRITLLRS